MNDLFLKKAKEIKNRYKVVNSASEKKDPKTSFLDDVNDLLKSIFDIKDSEDALNIVIDADDVKQWKKKRLLRNIIPFLKKNFYLAFLVAIIAFLISESAPFYTIDGVVTGKSWFKAVLTEISFIFLSAYKTDGRWNKLFVNFLRVAVFSLMLVVISFQSIEHGVGKISTTSTIEKQIKFIESQIKEKEKEIKYYREINWPKNATRAAIEKEKLSQELRSLRDKKVKEKRNSEMSQIETARLLTKSVFRVILVLLGALISRRVFVF